MHCSHPTRWLAGALLALVGCSTSDDIEVASSFIKTVDVKAQDGATIEVSAAESPELAGTKLVIPAGSLAADTTISVALQRQSIAVAPNLPAGAVAIWGPAGTTFTTGAELTMPFTLAADQALAALYLQVVEEDGTRAHIEGADLVAAARDAGVATATIHGFTRYQNAVHGCASGNPPPEHIDHTCPAGTVCHRGRCEPDPTPNDPELCTGGADEDGDGLVDCNDNLDCDQDPACAPPHESDCADRVDNDGDGYTDCDDTDCANNEACGCFEATGAPCVEDCADQVDNDEDGLVDCYDTDCANATECSCPCCDPTTPGCAEPELICDDQIDNDGDGGTDCRDSDCFDTLACAPSCCMTWDQMQNPICLTTCDPAAGNCYCSPSFCASNGGPCP